MTENATKEPWWVHHADHMKGWEAFGVTGSEPLVRRLGMATVKRGKVTTEEQPGTTPFGPGEVKLGVAAVEFSTSADDTGCAFIHVLGTTAEDVERRWHRAEVAFHSVASVLWPTSRQEMVGEATQ